MGRRPVGRPSGTGDALSERLRELREQTDLDAADRRRLERIIRDIGAFERFDLDELFGRPGDASPVRPGPIGGDFSGASIRPAQIGTLVGEAAAQVPREVDALHFVTGTALDRLRRELPEALPQRPVPVGRKGAALPLDASGLATLVRLAAMRRAEGADSVVWDDGINQLIVHAAKVRATAAEGMIRVAVPVECDQIRATMEVPFATGSGTRVAGMILATADRPAGDPVVARVWGEALVAFCYGAILDVADSLAGASGRDERNDRLVPRALRARRGQLVVESQARFVYGRASR